MDPFQIFESLAGVRPGVSTVGEAMSRFGTATICEASEGGFFYSFAAHSIHVLADGSDRESPDPIVTEVSMTPPSCEVLPCGVWLGQRSAEAVRAVRQVYRVTAEYEDAIYFRPSTRGDLLACVEFVNGDVVTGIELILEGPPRVPLAGTGV